MGTDNNRTIYNPHDLETIVFLDYPEDTEDGCLRYKVSYRGGGKSAHAHTHPTQEQRLTVLSGKMGFRIGSDSREYGPGETLSVAKGLPHYQWNAGDSDVVILQEQHPAGEMESFLRNSFGLVQDGRMNTLQVAATLLRYRKVLAHAGWQRWILTLLAPLAWILGYRGGYEEYERR